MSRHRAEWRRPAGAPAGLVSLVTRTFHSQAWLLVAAAFVIPALCFAFFGARLRGRWRAWRLLAIVLLLSLCVSGINVSSLSNGLLTYTVTLTVYDNYNVASAPAATTAKITGK